MQFFDRRQDYSIDWRKLPHWNQPGTACFITWRTIDSLPEAVLNQFRRDRSRLLRQYGIDSQLDWRSAIGKLPLALRHQLQSKLFERWDRGLDLGHGDCVLCEPRLAQIVADNLLFGDGGEYEVSDFVVMPNHVHLLAAFFGEETMLTQCESWKRYSATRINRELGRRGAFWQVESFDHLVRSSEWFEYYRQYIASNPIRAGLRPGSYLHFTKDHSVGGDRRDPPEST